MSHQIYYVSFCGGVSFRAHWADKRGSFRQADQESFRARLRAQFQASFDAKTPPQHAANAANEFFGGPKPWPNLNRTQPI
jgi:hypothetical protein